MRIGGMLALALLWAGCFGPQLDSGQFRCEEGFCPAGFACIDDLCVSEGSETDDPDSGTVAAVDASPDAAVDAPMVQNLCYGEVPTQVVIGQVYAANTMIDGFDNADGCDGRGPEHYYELVLTADQLPADVTFDINSNGYDPVLRVRQGTCDDEQAEFVCTDNGNSEQETRTINVPGSYFILVDSHGFSDGGEYELTVTLN